MTKCASSKALVVVDVENEVHFKSTAVRQRRAIVPLVDDDERHRRVNKSRSQPREEGPGGEGVSGAVVSVPLMAMRRTGARRPPPIIISVPIVGITAFLPMQALAGPCMAGTALPLHLDPTAGEAEESGNAEAWLAWASSRATSSVSRSTSLFVRAIRRAMLSVWVAANIP